MPDPSQPARMVKEKRVRPVPAVSRAIAILRLLGKQTQGLGVKAIADELGLVPSTCLHILRVLVDEDVVRVDPATKRYSLGSGMVGIAKSALEKGGFTRVAQPALERLAASTGVTAMGVELTAKRTILVLAVAKPDQPFQLHADIGSEFPRLTSATGRIVAAHAGVPLSQLRGEFDRTPWNQRPAFDAWKQDVEEAQARGWALDRDAFTKGLTAVAVPILNPEGALTHTLVCVGLSSEMASKDLPAMAEEMHGEARLISEHLHPWG